MIVERTAGVAGRFERDRRGMLAAAEEIDLDEVDLAGEQLLLLPAVEFAAVLPGRLVRQAEDLDRRDEPLAFLAPGVDLDEGLAEFVVRDPDDDGARDGPIGNGGGPSGFGPAWSGAWPRRTSTSGPIERRETSIHTLRPSAAK